MNATAEAVMNQGKVRVLLADDHAILREGLAMLIGGEEDMEVIAQAENGREAVRLACDEKPDVAVLDVSMPLMDGLETARRLRDRDATSGVRIMLLTARVTDADRERGRAAGVDDQLDKPFSPAVLAERVRALCEDGPNREHER